MPELPDVTVYIEELEKRILGRRVTGVRIFSLFLLRTVEPKLEEVVGKKVVNLGRLGKRICIGVEGGIWMVLHLMIAGRLHWYPKDCEESEGLKKKESQNRRDKLSRRNNGKVPKLGGRHNLAAIDFESGTLVWTEAGSQKRASLHVVRGEEGLAELDPGGLEVLTCTLEEFATVLLGENHTLKRALTDPRWFSGIGNAYSDEILWEARMSPTMLTQKMKGDEVARLFAATRETLSMWVERLRAEAGGSFPEKVTAFRPEMAVHGKYRQACPRCGSEIQRIAYASNETNYCATCQTGGKVLADRGLSRLLKGDWPRTLEELETMKRPRG
jgi:formamidopyrimidine-DNA glycosylase